jgi:activator of 2-hydroxyglutaryl-CoA dehydratase
MPRDSQKFCYKKLAFLPIPLYKKTDSATPQKLPGFPTADRDQYEYRKRRIPMKPYAFGVDIGGTTVKIGFFETQGTLLKKWEIPTRKDHGGSLILSDIAESLQQEMKAQKLKKDDIEGIGVSVAAHVGIQRVEVLRLFTENLFDERDDILHVHLSVPIGIASQ